LREFENGCLRLLLRPLPKAWTSRLEPWLAHARFRGVIKLLFGALATLVLFLFLKGLGVLMGHTWVSVSFGLPLAVSFIGLTEIVLGIEFTTLSERFDQGNALVKLGILVVVLAIVAAYLAGAIVFYQRYLAAHGPRSSTIVTMWV
jgi:hypothetical protein